MTRLGDDWITGADGVPYRRAARVVLLDSEGNVLLFRGHDGDDPDHRWWFTVGGGLDPGEGSREGAARELEEETGIVVEPGCLIGPVAHRLADFQFTNQLARQEEDFYLHVLDSVEPPVDTSNHTGTERQLVDGWDWFSSDRLLRELETTLVFPLELPSLLERWHRGWDGAVWHLFEVG